VDYWLVDILSHFPFQYSLVTLILLIICFWKKDVYLVMLAGSLFIFNCVGLIDLGESVHAEGTDGKIFKIYSANINRFNKNLGKLKDEINNMDTEIVVLIEVTPDHARQLKPVIQKYPYHIIYTPVGTFGLGMALLSKFPISDHHFIQLSKVGNSLLEVILEINQKKVTCYAIHFQNPVFLRDFSIRKRQFLRLANEVAEKSMPVIVAGDFNSTPYSPIFRKLLKISRLKDSSNGFGWQPSWHASFPPLWLPIDHILVSSEIKVHKRDTGLDIGSDHYPSIARLSLNL
jgi:endonuclease/exonuclease/phosphatase (EEP) superfamily protein YafD